MSHRVPGLIVPGTMRIKTVVTEYAVVTVACGDCGHEQEVTADAKMPWCRRCGRQMVIQRGEGAENVVPLRRAR
jgi:ribosomal protein S27E